MIHMVNKEFISDNLPGEGVLVIDTHLQGVWETGDLAKLRWAFPRVYNAYRRTCMKDYNRVGTSMLIEEAGYKVALLFTKKTRNDSKIDMFANLNLALHDLIRKVPSDVWIYSPIIARKDRCFNQVKPMISGVIANGNYNWFVYRKG